MSTEHYIAPTAAPSVAENADMFATFKRLADKGYKIMCRPIDHGRPAPSAPKGLPAEEAAQNG